MLVFIVVKTLARLMSALLFLLIFLNTCFQLVLICTFSATVLRDYIHVRITLYYLGWLFLFHLTYKGKRLGEILKLLQVCYCCEVGDNQTLIRFYSTASPLL